MDSQAALQLKTAMLDSFLPPKTGSGEDEVMEEPECLGPLEAAKGPPCFCHLQGVKTHPPRLSKRFHFSSQQSQEEAMFCFLPSFLAA